MSAAALLAIVVATGETHDPATVVMVAVAADSLGSQVLVRLLPASQPADVDLHAIERDLGASAVVTLVWIDPTRLRARLRLHVAAGERTTTRELVFDPADSRAERGRTLGLATASMWPEITGTLPAAPRPRGPPDVPTRPVAKDARPADDVQTPAPPDAAARPRADERVVAAATPVASPARDDRGARAAEVIARAQPPAARLRVGIGAIGAAAIDGTAGELGGRVEGLLRITDGWSLRLGLGLRRATIAELPGYDYAAALAGGVEWWPAVLSWARTASVGLRADAIALRHDVRATVLPGRPEQRTRYLPAADLLAQLAVRVGRRFEILAAGGVEGALGRTDLRSGQTPVTVASIPALRLTAEAGLRVGF
ncbi:MAG TPA: hypothetical protein VFH68_01805 [Polyangia bacterium]|jgi:hypothetical protein|nr:hypothetical protein [Polyangia bacterium]